MAFKCDIYGRVFSRPCVYIASTSWKYIQQMLVHNPSYFIKKIRYAYCFFLISFFKNIFCFLYKTYYFYANRMSCWKSLLVSCIAISCFLRTKRNLSRSQSSLFQSCNHVTLFYVVTKSRHSTSFLLYFS